MTIITNDLPEVKRLKSELLRARAALDEARADNELQQKNITFKAKQLVELRAERDRFGNQVNELNRELDALRARLRAATDAGGALTFDEWHDNREWPEEDKVRNLSVLRECWQAAQRAAPLPQALTFEEWENSQAGQRAIRELTDGTKRGALKMAWDDSQLAALPPAPAENGE